MKVNGKEISLPRDMTLLEYLRANGYEVTRIAVERNGEIVSKAEYRLIILEQDDVLEIVSFVGGG